eukprot:CAMPEP_0172206802 /NCGR_PEP_ID=MMETSP1050-20130122/33441_1 /TAXON_ID=233186 /ORGANISM="Cryptomonas curvata, Strain CCAP979/52" /LENGTH=140 /DNA_ID=CAMNT_0012885967 /DNA_START=114 /DNA_END=532 /DNA_ORIENTATION=+
MGMGQSVFSRLALNDEDNLPLLAFQGHSGAVLSITVSQDGKMLATGGMDKAIRLWVIPHAPDSLHELAQSETQLIAHTGRINSLAFRPHCSRLTLASAGNDGVVVLWDVETGRPAARLRGHARAVHSVAYSGDGSMLASG